MNKIVAWFKSIGTFLKEVWAEVRPKGGRVTWPTLDMVKAYTRMVIVGSVLFSAFIALLDLGFGQLVRMILGGRS